ncbi:fused DSP-PTPase phosphatase/NAD kinase-like protein [Candidatus Uabimicrobium amorphum]|uniref:Tyrosine specific protein phosphatases domain-containing protein n=1 Tax=Uabimicrobium amorphum TaxID=2596890 RepID=A0A5S9IS32_UABAM|nr:dual specificity protein phosphatase family protein [Candidatus Uabimicrobium amorphum]BBM85645.1 hypothetical protein UABAM_04019 [Candidatus Uabimicrobium amorphum]
MFNYLNISLAIIFIGLLVCYMIYRHKLLYHFGVVDKYKLYRSGTLSEKGLKAVHAKCKLKTIVSLRREYECTFEWYEKQKNFCKQNNIDFVEIRMDKNDPPKDDQAQQFIDIAFDEKRQPVLVHCEAGAIRTATMVLVYLKNKYPHRSNEELVKEISFFGHPYTKKRRERIKEFLFSYEPNV